METVAEPQRTSIWTIRLTIMIEEGPAGPYRNGEQTRSEGFADSRDLTLRMALFRKLEKDRPYLPIQY